MSDQDADAPRPVGDSPEETQEGGSEEKSNRGRPTEYRLEFCEIAANLCISGATDFEVAQHLNVHVSTLYRWQAAHPEFREALKVGKELADDRVEASLYHRAVGYSHHAVKIMQDKGKPVIVPYVEHVPPDTGALTLWLTNRRADKWKSKSAHELTGKNGAPLIPRSADDLTDEQLATIAAGGGAASAEPPKSTAER